MIVVKVVQVVFFFRYALDSIVIVVLIVFRFVVVALIDFGFFFSKTFGLKAAAIQLKALTLQNNVDKNL